MKVYSIVSVLFPAASVVPIATHSPSPMLLSIVKKSLFNSDFVFQVQTTSPPCISALNSTSSIGSGPVTETVTPAFAAPAPLPAGTVHGTTLLLQPPAPGAVELLT